MNSFSEPLEPQTTSNNRKPAYIVGLLVICLLAMAAAFSYASINSRFDNEYVRLSEKLRLHILEFIKHSTDSTYGMTDAFVKLKETENSFTSTLGIINKGDPKIGLPASPAQNKQNLQEIANLWEEHQNNIHVILNSEKSIRITNKFVKAINDVIPDIEDSSEVVITELVKNKYHANLIFVASHQLLLAQRIYSNINQIDRENTNINQIIDTLKKDTKTFRNVLESMLKGNKKTNITRISDKKVRKQIEDTLFLFVTVEELVSRVQEQSLKLHNARNAKNTILNDSDKLLNGVNKLIQGYESNTNTKQLATNAGFALGAFSILLLIWLGISVNRITRTELDTKDRSNKETVDAIRTLQHEIEPFAKGDLTINASVTPGITESIAEAINYTIEATRQLVKNIDTMAAHVSETAEETQATAIHLARASDQQAQQLTIVADAVNKMAHSFNSVSKQAEESTQLSSKAVEMAEQGGLAVRNTIKGMQTIKEDIYDTSNRVKRLGESSQEIGAVVELINGIADQTNILALNAAIKASVAGETGQNFTVVADEVQQLAERVTQATQKIESLVKSIQLDTSQAVISMEQSITNVIHGTKLAEAAGDALLRIETVSAHLADFIDNVANATLTLTDTSKQTSQTMNAIKKVTVHNLASTKQTAALTGKLAELAQEQRATIHGFKLPES